MLPEVCTVVSPEKFDVLFQEEGKIAQFSSTKEEIVYEKRDSFLIHLIKRLGKEHFGKEENDSLLILEDWWPNYTRYLDMTPLHYTNHFLTALHELLKDEFVDYRIAICIYEDIYEATTYIGSMVLYAERIVIETELQKLLQNH